MTDPLSIALVGVSMILALMIAGLATLRGWQGWLDFKRLELASQGAIEPSLAPTSGRIELADLRERVRKLEAIAAGIEL